MVGVVVLRGAAQPSRQGAQRPAGLRMHTAARGSAALLSVLLACPPAPLPQRSNPIPPALRSCCSRDAEGQETRVIIDIAGEGFTATGAFMRSCMHALCCGNASAKILLFLMHLFD